MIMKLPAESGASTEDQVLSASTGGASSAGSSSSEGGGSSNSSGAGTTPSGSGSESGSGTGGPTSANPQSGPGPQDVDFSEFLWMENEEEFDSQVLQELEDEEMINYYYELYEASLNENGTWGPNTANLRVTGPPPPLNLTENREDDPVDSLAQGITSRLTFNSRLNPEAAEFVPRAPTNMSSPN